jgi:putative transposase
MQSGIIVLLTMTTLTKYPWDGENRPKIHPTKGQLIFLAGLFATSPVRCARNFGCNVIGLFPSIKIGKSVEFESGTIERFIVFLLEICRHVVRFKEQPLTLQVPRENKMGVKVPQRYTPDFLAELDSGKFVFLEGKSEGKLQRHVDRGGTYYFQGSDGRWHDPAAEEVCRNLGAEHMILTESDFCPTLMRNLHFLFEFIAPEKPDDVFGKKIRGRIARRRDRTTTLQDLDLAPEELAKLNCLIATGRIPSSINYRSIHDPEQFLLFADGTTLLAWEQTQCQKRPLNLAVFQMVEGTEFLWRSEPYKCRKVHGDQVIVQKGVKTDTLSLEHLRLEWENGWLTFPSADFEVNSAAAKLPSGLALKAALYRLDVLEGAKTDVSNRTVREWRRIAREAEAAGVSVVDALAPKTKRRGFRLPRVDTESLRELDEFLRENYFVPHKPKAIFCFRKYQQSQRNVGKTPVGKSTFFRRIKTLRDLLNGKRIGKKKLYSMLAGLHDYNGNPVLDPEGEFAFAVGQVDSTPIDVVVLNKKGELVTRRIWLTVLIDAHSRFILGWYLSFRNPSKVSCSMVIRDCIRRHGRVPHTIIVDNGSEFHSHFFRRIVIGLGSELLYRPPHMPRHGAISERFFRTANDGLFHNLEGNTQHLKDPRSMGPDVDPRRYAIETFESLYQKFEHWVLNYYHHRPHQGLGATPNQVFQDSCARTGILLRNTVKVDQRFLCETAIEIESTTRQLHTNWVVVNNIRYKSNELRDTKYVGTNVEVRWDPEDVRVVYVLLGEKWIVAKSSHFISICNCDQQRLRIVSDVVVDGALSAAKDNSVDAPQLPETKPASPIPPIEFEPADDNLDDDEDWTSLIS